MFRVNLILLAALATSLLSQSLLRGADLFRLVQPDAAACMHLSGLTGNWQRLEQSEFATRLQASPFFADMTDAQKYAELTAVKGALEAVLQRPLREAVESLFGQNVVLATYAVPGAEPDFVLLLEADNAASIDAALKAWQALDGFQPVDQEHRGVTYRSLNKPGRADARNPLIAQFDRVLVVAQKAERMQRLIDLRLDESSESLATLEPFVAAISSRPQTELAAVYLNPRVLDSAVAYVADRPEQWPRAVQSAWQRCRWLTLRLVLDTDRQTAAGPTLDDLQLEAIADYDSQGTPAWWQQWVDVATTETLPLNRIPQNAVLTLSGQFSAESLQALIRNILPNEGELSADARRVRRVSKGLLLGLDPLNGLLPALGPNWLVYCVPRPPTEAKDFPVDALIALDLRPELAGSADDPAADTQPSMQDGLDNALLTGLNLLAAEHNSRTTGPVAVLRHKAVAEGTIRWAEPVSRFRPAYAVSNRYLLVASSPELCEQFLTNAAGRAAGGNGSDAKAATEPTQYWLARSTVARQILESHRDWFLWQARRDQLSDDEAGRRLTELDSLLKLADQAEASATLSATQVRASLSLSATTAAAE